MPKTTLAGHPLHPQIVVAPAALLPFSLAMDVAHGITGNDVYAELAYHSMLGGFGAGLAAAAAGVGDYVEIRTGTRERHLGAVHASMNAVLLGAYGVNLMVRRRRTPPTGRVPFLLSLLGTVGLTVSAWYGAHLVYEHGLRVRGADPLADAPEARLPAEERLERRGVFGA